MYKIFSKIKQKFMRVLFSTSKDQNHDHPDLMGSRTREYEDDPVFQCLSEVSELLYSDPSMMALSSDSPKDEAYGFMVFLPDMSVGHDISFRVEEAKTSAFVKDFDLWPLLKRLEGRVWISKYLQARGDAEPPFEVLTNQGTPSVSREPVTDNQIRGLDFALVSARMTGNKNNQ